MRSRYSLVLALSATLVGVAACGGGQATPGPATQAPPASEAPASMAAGATVVAQSVGDAGTILVDGATGMTVYWFEQDTKDSGTSACTGECLENWPALTVASGESPTGGDGVDASKLGTITREDTGDTQVTYDGLPLYFFANDQEPGDLNGVYENWVTVAP